MGSIPPIRASLSSSHSLSRLQTRSLPLQHRSRPNQHPCLSFHTTIPTPASTPSTTPKKPRSKASHRSPYRSITQAELNRIKQARANLFQSYTSEEKAQLDARYFDSQFAAIEAGEAAISPADLGTQWRIRGDKLTTVRDVDRYADSRILPTIDKRVDRINGEGDDYNDIMAKGVGGKDWSGGLGQRFTDSMFDDIIDIVAEPEPEDADDPFLVELENAPDPRDEPDLQHNDGLVPDQLITSGEAEESARELGQELGSETRPESAKETMAQMNAILAAPTKKKKDDRPQMDRLMEILPEWKDHSEAPQLPKFLPERGYGKDGEEPGKGAAEDEERERVARGYADALGITVDAVRNFTITPLVSNYVANMTGLGKVYRYRVVVVAGNGDGMLGMGMGGSSDIAEATRIAGTKAMRNVVPIHRYERRTVLGELKAKVGAVEVTLSPRAPGFGLRCSERVHKIAVAAGISDLSARVGRGRNKMNASFAVFEALKKQKDPEELARARGKKFVDVRKVYYAGLV